MIQSSVERGHFRNAKTFKFILEGNVGIGCASVVKWILTS